LFYVKKATLISKFYYLIFLIYRFIPPHILSINKNFETPQSIPVKNNNLMM